MECHGLFDNDIVIGPNSSRREPWGEHVVEILPFLPVSDLDKRFAETGGEIIFDQAALREGGDCSWDRGSVW